MFKSSCVKKALAVVLSLSMLLSCMAVVGVSAANGNGVNSGAMNGMMEANYDTVIKNGSNNRYPTGGGGDNLVNAERSALQVTTGNVGRNGSAGAMRLCFTAAPADNNCVGYRLFDQARSDSTANKGEANAWYQVSFWYKVEAPAAGTAVGDATGPVNMNLDVLYGSKNWADDTKTIYTANVTVKHTEVVDVTTATDWRQVTTIFKAPNQNGFHIALFCTDGSKAQGASVLIDDMAITEVPSTSFATISFDVDGGTDIAPINMLKGNVSLSGLPAASKPGFRFDGWKLSGSLLTADFNLTDNVTLVAQYSPVTVVPGAGGGMDFEGITDISGFATNVNKPFVLSTAKNHTDGGAQSLKTTIQHLWNAQRGRPRIVLKDAEGNNLKVTAGYKYTVTFWVYTDRTGANNFTYWLASMNNLDNINVESGSVHLLQTLDAAETNGALNGNGNEVVNVSLTAGGWTQLRATIPAATLQGAGDNYLALGFTMFDCWDSSWSAMDLYIDDIVVTAVDPSDPGPGPGPGPDPDEPVPPLGEYVGNGGNGVDASAPNGVMEANYNTAIQNGSNVRYPANGGGDNSGNTNSCKVAQVTDEGRGDTKGAMKISFNSAPSANDVYSGFRLFDQARSDSNQNKGIGGTWYYVTFWYKVGQPTAGSVVADMAAQGIPVQMNLDVLYGSRNWSNALTYDSQFLMRTSTIDVTQPSADWIKYTALFNANGVQGFHIALRALKKDMAAGANVYIDDMSVEAVAASDVVTITFDNAGGEGPSSMNARKGESIPVEALPKPTVAGKMFDKWLDETDTPLTGSLFVQRNLTLKASYYENTNAAMVTLYPNGGDKVMYGKEDKTAVPIETLKNAAGEFSMNLSDYVVTRDGYEFIGWFADPLAREEVTAITTHGEHSLYAGWMRKADEVQNFEDYGVADVPILLTDFSGSAIKKYYNKMQANYFYTNRTSSLNHPDADFGIVSFGGGKAMKMSYVAGQTQSIAQAGFRIGGLDDTGVIGRNVNLTGGLLYQVSFDYTVKNAPVDGAITVFNGSCNWGNPKEADFAKAARYDALTFTAGSVDSGHVEYIFKAKNAAGVHLALTTAAADMANRGGMEVYVTNVRVILYKRSADDLGKYGDAVIVEGAETNHTSGGNVAAKLKAANTAVAQTNRVLFSNLNGNVKLALGKKYVASVWLRADADINGAALRIMSDLSTEEAAMGDYAEKLACETTLDLKAGKWIHVEQFFELKNIPGQTEAYVSIGVADAAGSGTAVAMDDISIVEYVPDMNSVQTYERFPAGVQADGSAIVEGHNHSLGGNKSVALTVTGTAARTAARTVLKVDYDNFEAVVGKGYVVQFWAYSEQGGKFDFCLGSSVEENLAAAGRVDCEENSHTGLSLVAGKWVQVGLLVPAVAGKSLANGDVTHLTVNVWATGASAAAPKTLYIDDVLVSEYVPYDTSKDVFIDTFEKYDLGTDLTGDLSTGKITVSASQNHTEGGLRSAMFTTHDGGGATRPQMNIHVVDKSGNPVTIEAGKDYSVFFYVYTDADNAAIRYWLTANADPSVKYANGAEKDTRRLAEAVNVTLQAGQWNEIRTTVSGTDIINGTLRLGIDDDKFDANNRAGTPVTFFIDDITVKEILPVALNPNATSFDFEAIAVGNNAFNGQKFVLNGNGTVSDRFNHTEDGNHSLMMNNVSWAGTDRNQTVVLDPKTCEPIKVTAGDIYTLSFWVYIRKQDVHVKDEEPLCMRLNHWVIVTNDISGRVTKSGKVEFDKGGTSDYQVIPADTWTEVVCTFTAKTNGYVVLGTTDVSNIVTPSGDNMSRAVYYLDDISLVVPNYLTVHFDGNGSDDVFSDIKTTSGSYISFNEADPYRFGYEFTGWYRTPECKPEDKVDFQFDKIIGEDGATITFYAGWAERQLDTGKDEENNSDKDKQPDTPVVDTTPKYEDKVYYEEELVPGPQPKDPVLEAGDRPEIEEAEPVSSKPDKTEDKDKNSGNKNEGMATWLIIVIIAVAVVVVGGGAALALILLKKKA